MAHQVFGSPYDRMDSLAPTVCYKTLNNKTLQVFFDTTEKKSYNELFDALLNQLKSAMKKTFSEDPFIKNSHSPPIDQDRIDSMAEHYSSCYKSLQYIEGQLKEFGYQPPPSTTKHEWCILS